MDPTTFDPLKDLDGYPEIYYQFVIKFDNGTSYNLGPQGTIRNLPGHTYFEESSTGDAQNAAAGGQEATGGDAQNAAGDGEA